MRKRRGWTWFLAGWLILMMGGLFNLSCLAPYYYDHGRRVWRDGHDDDWHRQHGDHWNQDHHDQDQGH